MIENLRFYRRLTLIALSLLAPAVCAAVDSEENRWYQVELFVFASTDLNAGDNERWPEQPALKYPAPIAHLHLPISEQAASDEELFSDAATTPAAVTDDVTVVQQGESADKTTDLLPAAPDNFLLLDAEHFQLKPTVQRISQQKDYRPLTHLVWQQLIKPKNEAEHIVITGGDQFDDHYELEGTIQLSVERYLHIETDLWLSSFVVNSGLFSDLWHTLPGRPIDTRHSLVATQIDPLQDSFNNSLYDGLFAVRNQQYQVERTVVLRQHRRMRSGELHYIDHPLFGLLIKITPIDVDKENLAGTKSP